MQESDKQQKQIKTVGLVMIITLLGKVSGLLRDMFMGFKFATGVASNAFQTASQIPRNFFDAVFASAISSSFIPIFNETMEKQGKDEAFRLSQSFFTLMGLFTLVLSGLGMLFAQPITAFVASGFDEETAALCTRLLQMLFPTVFFTGIAFSMVGVLQSLGEFNIPAAMSLFSNGIIIIYYVFFCDRFGVYGLAVAFLIGWAAQALVQVPFLHKMGFRYRVSLWHPGLKRVFTLMLPVMVSTWIQPINQLISTRFASYIDGGVSAMNYANTLYTMLAGILVLSVTNVIFPEMSRLTSQGKREELRDLIRSSLQSLMFLLTPLTVGLMLLATPLVQLLYQHGTWTAESTAITSRALTWMAVGMVGYGVQNVLLRAYYAEKNGRIPMITGGISILLNLVLCMALSSVLDVAGLALATALASTASAVLLMIFISRKMKGLFDRAFWTNFARIVLCTAGMGAVVFVVYRLLHGLLPASFVGILLELGISTAAGIVVYFAAALVLKIPETAILRRILNKFIKPKEGV